MEEGEEMILRRLGLGHGRSLLLDDASDKAEEW
jgi:hypothetical protein